MSYELTGISLIDVANNTRQKNEEEEEKQDINIILKTQNNSSLEKELFSSTDVNLENKIPWNTY